MLKGGADCWRCGAPATTIDHVPPLSTAPSPELWEGELRPACKTCNYGHGLGAKRRRGRRLPVGQTPGRVEYRRR